MEDKGEACLKKKAGLNFMAPAVGLEPTTDRLTADCSTTELRRNKTDHFEIRKRTDFNAFGGRCRNRTDIKGFAVLCISHSANRPSDQSSYSFTQNLKIRQGKKIKMLENNLKL